MKITVKVPKKKKIPVFITTDYIRLDSALKLSNAVSSGGRAKSVVQDMLVKVNGEVCPQRGKKLREGDCFEFERTVYEVKK